MNTEEINRYIHEEIMGKCVHANRRTFINPGPVFTERCTDCDRLATVPDYCSDDSPRRLLNEVMAKVDGQAYEDSLTGEYGYNNVYTAEQIARGAGDIMRVTARLKAVLDKYKS